jgi:hypothetical protein
MILLHKRTVATLNYLLLRRRNSAVEYVDSPLESQTFDGPKRLTRGWTCGGQVASLCTAVRRSVDAAVSCCVCDGVTVRSSTFPLVFTELPGWPSRSGCPGLEYHRLHYIRRDICLLLTSWSMSVMLVCKNAPFVPCGKIGIKFWRWRLWSQ